MKLTSKRIAVLAENLYQELELWYPVLRLREEGAEVIIVGPKKQTYESKHGYPVLAELSAKDANADDFDAVVVPGGFAPDQLRKHQSVTNFVRNMYNQGKIVSAICHGPSVLVSAHILKGKKATCCAPIKDDLVYAGAIFVNKEVVRDKNIITSRYPSDLPAFCRMIIKALTE